MIPEILIGFFTMVVRMSVPYLLGSMGELYSQKSGVTNLGLEGMMTVGTFAAFLGAYFTNNRWIGLLAAIISCIIVGILYALMVVVMRMNQSITSISFNLLIVGSASFVYRIIFGTPSVMPFAGDTFSVISIPLLSKIPWIGPILFQQYGMVYIALFLVGFSIFFFNRTKAGIVITACGEKPEAAETRGVNVIVIRILCVLVSAGMAGVVGTYMSIGIFNQYTAGMVAGRGYIAYALVIFGKWNPKQIFIGALLFGCLEAVALVAQASLPTIPYQFLMMAPYALTVVALVVTSLKSRNARPACLGVPYKASK